MAAGESTHTHHRSATLMGFGAILLWASLTALTQLVSKVPALQLTCVTFAMAFVLALVVWRIRGEAIAPKFKMPWLQWVVGVPAVTGNIVFFFIGIKFAPIGQANMLNYLWPLELVLLSSLLPGQKLKWTHILGVVLGVLGIMVLFTGRGQDSEFLPGAFWGYAAAFAGGLCWASYSVFRRATVASAGGAGSDAIMLFVGGTALVTGVLHLLFEKTYVPVKFSEWLGLVLLAAGPTWGAYGLWEVGIKKGDIRLLGIGSFMIPLLSTGLLVLGGAPYSHTLLVSCLLVVAGAGVASIDALRKPKG